MATISQIRGMLLEEAVLYLLRTSGYTPVLSAGSDPTLYNGHSGLEVFGRGGKHQIDAIADPIISLPFSNSSRLLVEAKCFSGGRPVGLHIIRNTVGVLKDVSEFWVPPNDPNRLLTIRPYHYQFAIFSASGYSIDAERYAFAHDIYLIQYQNSLYMYPIIQKILDITFNAFMASTRTSINVNMTELRKFVRNSIRDRYSNYPPQIPVLAVSKIRSFIDSVLAINGTLLAIAGRRFPIHLIPAPNTLLSELNDFYTVRITWDDRSWYLKDTNDRTLFSFDLPSELFNLYTEHGMLSETGALNLKEDILNTIQAILTIDNGAKIITFQLDMEWIKSIRSHSGEFRRRYSESG